MTRKRIAKSGAVRENEIGLKLGEAIVGNARVSKQAETRVDAIDGLAARNDSLHAAAEVAMWSSEALSSGFDAEPELSQLVERNILGIELHTFTIGKSRPCSRAQSIAIS